MSEAQTNDSSLWKSTGLRLAALFGFLVLLGMLAALALVYLQVSVVLHQNVDRQLLQEQQRIVRQYEKLGAQSAALGIAQQLSDGKDTDSELLLLMGSNGQALAGNLQIDAIANPAAGFQGLQRLLHGGVYINAQIMVHRFDDGALLVVGHDLRELRDIESTVATASLIAGAFALVLAAIGAWWFRRELARSVGAVHTTIMRISGGQLQSRVPLSTSAKATPDEFERLEQDFNHMLDHIEQLMSGVQHVSDAIAHNVRTPLTRIRLRMQTALLDETASNAALRDSMAAAMEEIDSLSHMLEKLLAIAQAEAGMRRDPFVADDWARIAQEVIELYEDLADEQNVRIDWRCEHPAPLLGDHSLLAAAVVNVLDNAIKYAGSGHVVNVTARQSGDERFSELVIQDNGEHAPDDDAIASLGQRFVRLHADQPGHGLGLASVRATLQLHGGEMLLESAHPGLRVCLRLPSITSREHTQKPHKQASNITALQ